MQTPKEIVAELDKYIIGQDRAKKAVAVAMRNRYRRSLLDEKLKDEITPKNIILKGPTGVGKTEIARRLAKIANAPFVKVEATKFTEVGYVGRDVETMIKDLVETSVRMIKEEKIKENFQKAEDYAYKKLSEAIAKHNIKEKPDENLENLRQATMEELKEGKYDNLQIDVEVNDVPKNPEMNMAGMGSMEINLGDMFGSMFPKKKKRKKLKVKDALKVITNEEAERLIDSDSINDAAIYNAENNGIIFIDEIDKICGGGGGQGPNVSREGVQRDILPIVEGSTVVTKYGPIKTDYILFIAAGAFHVSSYQDLIPELQGRFPVTVELSSLNVDDFYKILTESKNSVIHHYQALLETDKIKLSFTEDALRSISKYAFEINLTHENIGARRLHTIMENLLEEISYNAENRDEVIEIVIDEKYVDENIKCESKVKDLKKYIL